jgi:hypothetical protein
MQTQTSSSLPSKANITSKMTMKCLFTKIKLLMLLSREVNNR